MVRSFSEQTSSRAVTALRTSRLSSSLWKSKATWSTSEQKPFIIEEQLNSNLNRLPRTSGEQQTSIPAGTFGKDLNLYTPPKLWSRPQNQNSGVAEATSEAQ